ncbi:MAG: zinc transporter ZupT [Bacteroidetes bacterium]|nr:MAG: zinc transporter ZupT [Bacteroidota bacterium]
MDDHQAVILAFGLTLFAGLSTGIGSAIAFFTKTTNTKFLSVSLGFSAGVMIYISFMEILPKSIEIMTDDAGLKTGNFLAIVGFFAGMLVIAIIDKLVPSFENPHEIRKVEDLEDTRETEKKRKLYRMGMMSALAIAIHNFPEGLATFIVALKDIKLGFPIAIAIAIHNIPEGIAVSVPIYYATGSRKKAFKYSFLSGLAEPLGALFGFLILMPFMNDILFGFIFASVAGIMVFISIDELLPAAREYDQPHLSLYGLMGGMAVMALSLILFL